MDIYAVNIEKLNELNFDYRTYSHIVSTQTLEKANSFKHYKDSIRTTIGELLIHYLYIQNHKELYNPLVILRNEYGKPYCNNNEFHFNISHAGDWVVCIIDTKPVGIDIEQVTDIDFEALIPLFHPLENQQLKISINKKEHFFKLWTIKECIIKNIGQGLSIPLSSFSVFLNQEVTLVHFEDDKFNGDEYHIKLFNFQQNYKLAICALHANLPESINILEPIQFLPFLINNSNLSK